MGTAGQATDDSKAHALCMLDKEGYKHTLRICNTYCFSMATIVTRKRLNVTLYVLCLSRWIMLTCVLILKTEAGISLKVW
jgi:hypothetical protein